MIFRSEYTDLNNDCHGPALPFISDHLVQAAVLQQSHIQPAEVADLVKCSPAADALVQHLWNCHAK